MGHGMTHLKKGHMFHPPKTKTWKNNLDNNSHAQIETAKVECPVKWSIGCAHHNWYLLKMPFG